MSEPASTLLLALLLIACFAAFIYFISRYSGWHTLAAHYPLRMPFPKPSDRFGYAVFRGWIGYNGGVIVAADSRGLYLRAMPVVLSFCHSPIHIPWSEIRLIESRRGFFSGAYRIHTVRAPEIEFALRRITFDAIRDSARRAAVPGEY